MKKRNKTIQIDIECIQNRSIFISLGIWFVVCSWRIFLLICPLSFSRFLSFSLSLFLCFSIAPFPLSLTLYFTLLTLHLSLVDYLVNATRFSIWFVSPPSSWFDKKNYLRSLAVALSLSLVLKHGRAEEKEIRTKLWLIPFVDIICFKSIRIYSLLFLSFLARKKTGRKNVFFFFLM